MLVQYVQRRDGIDQDEPVVCLITAGIPLQVKVLEEIELGEYEHQFLKIAKAVVGEIQVVQKLEVEQGSLECTNLVCLGIQLSDPEISVEVRDCFKPIVVEPERLNVCEGLKATYLLYAFVPQVQLGAFCTKPQAVLCETAITNVD